MAWPFERLTRLLSRLTSEPRSPGGSRIPYNGRTAASVLVTPDNAVTIAAVWACLRYLSQTVAALPWRVMRETRNGAERAAAHPIDYLIAKRPNPEWSSFQFRETLTHWALRWGNGYAEIEPDQLGRPYNLWPIHPERVEVCRATDPTADDYGDPIDAGEIFYEASNGDGGRVILSARHMFHLRGFGEGPVGVNVIHYAAQSIGWARAAQLFGAAFFGNGANVSFAVVNKKALTPLGLEEQRKEFDRVFGGVKNAHRHAHLDNDADIKTIGIDPEKSQLVETHQHLVEEICRWFGVPPHKVMHLLRATFSNIEHQAIEVVVDSVTPWVKRFEDEADFKLFGQNRAGFYTKMNMNALLRGDMAGRVAFYKGLFELGGTINQILALEDMNGIGPDGDIPFVSNNVQTLERAINGQPASGLGAPPPATDAGVAEQGDDDNADVSAALDRIDLLLNVDTAHVG